MVKGCDFETVTASGIEEAQAAARRSLESKGCNLPPKSYHRYPGKPLRKIRPYYALLRRCKEIITGCQQVENVVFFRNGRRLVDSSGVVALRARYIGLTTNSCVETLPARPPPLINLPSRKNSCKKIDYDKFGFKR